MLLHIARHPLVDAKKEKSMSATSLNFHQATEASAKVFHVNNSHWLALEFVDAKGGTLSLALFSESPEALLAAITGKSAPAEAQFVGMSDDAEPMAVYRGVSL
jgi:hypothetical protein